MNKKLTQLMEKDSKIQNHNFNMIVTNKITPEEYQLRMDRLSKYYQQRLCDILNSEFKK